VRRPGLAVFGAMSLIVGLAAAAVLAVAIYGDHPEAQHRALQLGLAGGLLASAVAQVLILVGGWALWSGLRRRP
jgi:hypothetical protein